MVNEEIFLKHTISKKGLEVDQANIEAMEKLPPLTNVKTLRNFLGHVGFYRLFAKDFSKLACPLSMLLELNIPYIFDDEHCLKAIETLNRALVTTPILIASDWT